MGSIPAKGTLSAILIETTGMDDELKKLLQENLDLARENNAMLRVMRRNAWISFFSKLFVWALLIIAPLYLLDRYLGPIVEQAGSGQGAFGLPSSADVQKLLEYYNGAIE